MDVVTGWDLTTSDRVLSGTCKTIKKRRSQNDPAFFNSCPLIKLRFKANYKVSLSRFQKELG